MQSVAFWPNDGQMTAINACCQTVRVSEIRDLVNEAELRGRCRGGGPGLSPFGKEPLPIDFQVLEYKGLEIPARERRAERGG